MSHRDRKPILGRAGNPVAWTALTCLALTSAAGAEVTKIYWTAFSPDKIQRSDPDGSNVETLVSPWGQPEDIALDVANGMAYWVSSISTGRIQRGSMDGAKFAENLVTGGMIHPVGIALDLTNEKLYWSDYGTDSISRADLDGSNPEVLVTGLASPDHIALDIENGKMYWTDNVFKIQRANLDGTVVETVLTVTGTPEGLALDLENSTMYWTESGGVPAIKRAGTNGTGVTVLVDASDGLIGARDIALDLDAGKIYWTEASLDKIMRANLDGTSIEDVGITGINIPVGLALDTSPALDCPEDANEDGVINVLDLIDVLLCFGLPATPGCETQDINEDGTVNVLDLIDVLLAFGAACP